MPQRRRNFEGGAPPKPPVEWLGSVRRLPMPSTAPGTHAPWIIVWYAPKHAVLQIAAIPRGGRVAAVRDALIAGIRRSDTAGAKLTLLVDAAQLHRDASEAFPEAHVVVVRDPAMEMVLQTPQAKAVLDDLARRHVRARLSVVEGGLESKGTRGETSSKTEPGPAGHEGRLSPTSSTTAPMAVRVLRLVRSEPTPVDDGPRVVSGSPTPLPSRVEDDTSSPPGEATPRQAAPHDEGGDEPSVDDDARTPSELIEALRVGREALATDDVTLEAVAHANCALVAAFESWDDGHDHDPPLDAEEVRPLDLLLELLATHCGATVATMRPEELELVLFDHLPTHGNFPPARATEIIGELQRFTRFLEREAAYRLAPAHRRLLTEAATSRLKKALDR